MRITIDRSLPVPVPAQLQGQIEYGVACGDVSPGTQLPSVRELTEELGVSPVTVTQVYRALQTKGLVITKPGSGTFVRDDVHGQGGAGHRYSALYPLTSKLMRIAEAKGISLAEITHLLSSNWQQPNRKPLGIVFVGTFEGATRSYVADIRAHLRPGDDIKSLTFGDLKGDDIRKHLQQTQLVITFAYRLNELKRYLAPGTNVTSLNFIPAERTRISLAEISPRASVGLIATFPEFLGALKDGVTRFAPHVEQLETAVFGDDRMVNVIAHSDVLVYATGSEGVMEGLTDHVRVLEYRHTPDPNHIEAHLLPLIENIRHQLSKENIVKERT